MGFERQVEGSHGWEETLWGAIVGEDDDGDGDGDTEDEDGNENEEEEEEEESETEATACLVPAALQKCVSQQPVCVRRCR